MSPMYSVEWFERILENMRSVYYLTDEHDWALRVFAIEMARGILKEDKTYEMLTDEQKIAFILAGGMPSLFRDQYIETDVGPETGQLPVFC
jgi:hypothetical protein